MLQHRVHAERGDLVSRRLSRREAKAANRVFTPAGPVTVVNTQTGETRTDKPYTASEQLDIVGPLAYREQPTRTRQRRR
jgi:hypothetical protein